MKRKILRTLGGAFALLLVLTAGEQQVFRFGADEAQAAILGDFPARDDRATPQQVLDQVAGQGDELTLLAAGDVAECGREDTLGQVWPALTYDLGLPVEVDRDGAGALRTAALADRYPDDLVLGLGDLAYHRGTRAEFDTCFDPLWGALVPRLLPTPGNHEYRVPGANGYYEYWGQQAGADRTGHYALTWRNWLLLSLNSEDDADEGSAQRAWLDAQLAAHPDACVLAYFHKPAWSLRDRSGSEAARALFARLEEAGATAVLNGHNHFYERTRPLDAAGQPAPEGLIGFTIGVGGETSHATPAKASTARAIFGETGLLRLTLGQDSLGWDFLSAGDGEDLDSGLIPCRARGQDA